MSFLSVLPVFPTIHSFKIARLFTDIYKSQLLPQISQPTIALLDGFEFEELRVQINPQSGAHAVIVVVDIDAKVIDRPAINDTGGVILIEAGRPQPPPAGGCVTFGIVSICPCTVCDCIGSRNALSRFITAKVSVHLIDTEQENLIHRCMAGFGFVRRIFIGADNRICYYRPLCQVERRVQESVVQPFTNCAG